MNTEIMFSSANDAWATPQNYFDKLNERFNFNLDPCAAEDSYKCNIYFTEKDDWLKQDWKITDKMLWLIWNNRYKNTNVFCNPPYSDLKSWIKKASEEIKKDYCDQIVMLIPSRTDTIAFHEYIYNKEWVEIEFIKWRLIFWTDAYWEWLWEQEFTYDAKGNQKKNSLYKKYGKKNPAPFPSMLVKFTR